ncbi:MULTISPECIES: oligosaccharide repeat unit polymerase [Enterobacterales]|uniref:oligosaccharide repeat unit polymerase n=1 Tax=Enterobacterales TaxID=91347 RepID=UPI002ED86A21
MTRKYLMSLYVFFNFSCAIYFGVIGKLGGDFKYESSSNVVTLVLSLMIVLFTFALIQGVIFNLFEKIPIKNNGRHVNKSALDWIMLIVVSFGIYSALIYKVGVLGVSKDVSEDAPKIIFYLNTIFQPALLVLIYLFYRYKSKYYIFYLNLLAYLILLLLSGQTGQLLLLLCLYFMRKPDKTSSLKLLLITLVGVGFYPFIRMLKDAIVQLVNNSGEWSGTFSTFLDGITIESYFSYLFITLERFQMVSNIHYLIDNGQTLGSAFQLQGMSDSFFSLFWIFSALARLLDIDVGDVVSAQDFFAYSINGIPTWSSQISMLGYFYFYGFLAGIIIAFILLLLFIAIRVSKYLSIDKEVTNLTWALSLLLICHGWFVPFMNYVQCLVCFSLIVMVFNIGNTKSLLYKRLS